MIFYVSVLFDVGFPHIFFRRIPLLHFLCTGLVPVVNMSGVVALSVGGR